MPIPRIPPPTVADFERDWRRPGRPCVIEGALAGSRAARLWTPDYLVRLLGDVVVPVVLSTDGLSATIPGHEQRWRVVDLSLSAALARIRSPAPPEPYTFVMQKTISRKLALLAVDLDLPPWVERERAISNNLWLGSDGVETPLHFDVAANLLAVFAGSKRVTLFPPGQTERLYPVRDWDARTPNRSHVDLGRFDAARHPLAVDAHREVVDLGPGDVLWLPPLWWHHVRSAGASLAVNFWWQARLGECLAENGLPMLRAEWARDRWAGLRRRVDLGGAAERAAAARFARARGAADVAAAIEATG